jgi:predicted PurR-regulated permease PerM
MSATVERNDIAKVTSDKPGAALETLAPAVEMPLPSDVGKVFQGGLFILALLGALYVAREIILPVVLAFVLMLLLYPALRMLERLRVPRMLSSLLLIGLLFGVLVACASALAGPAGTWAAKLPQGLPRLQEHLNFLRGPVQAVQQFLQQAEGYVGGNEQTGVASPAVPGAPAATASSLWVTLFTGTRAVAGGLFETVLVLFFLLLAGDTFLRRLVEILPRFSDKRQAVDISQQIEADISRSTS